MLHHPRHVTSRSASRYPRCCGRGRRRGGRSEPQGARKRWASCALEGWGLRWARLLSGVGGGGESGLSCLVVVLVLGLVLVRLEVKGWGMRVRRKGLWGEGGGGGGGRELAYVSWLACCLNGMGT